MRKVVLWMGMSVDGFTSGTGEQLDWLVPHATRPEPQAFFRTLRDRSDTLLLGRVNYEGFSSYWPAVQRDPKAAPDDVELSRWLDQMPKIVFSRTLREVRWQNARLATRTPEEEVRALKREQGKDILIQNSTRLTQSLLAHDLVDELNLLVAPAALGSGRSLFAGMPQRLELGMSELERLESGAFIVRYDVRRRR